MKNYYDQHASSFIESTIKVKMQPLYEKFLPHLPVGGKILDAGCGAGRDAKYFAKKGYSVTAFDASEELVKFAQAYTEKSIQHCLFTEFQSEEKFDGIWACASLLHVPYEELASTLEHLAQFLAKNGLFYCSFKLGDDEVIRDGRTFTNLTPRSLETLLYFHSTQLKVKEIWISDDLRKGRKNEQWLNAMLELR